jgi:hypothetical protein
LPSSGDYSVIVGGTRGNASYKLEVTIRWRRDEPHSDKRSALRSSASLSHFSWQCLSEAPYLTLTKKKHSF